MKKLLALVMVMALCLCMCAGCGAKKEEAPKADAPAAEEKKETKADAGAASGVAQKDSFTMYGCYVEAEMAGLTELFTKETGIKVNYVRLSAGELQARVGAEKDNPQVSMILGVGTDVALAMDEAGLLDHYVPENIGDIYPEYVNADGVFVPLHIIFTCFGSNTEWLAEHGLEAPTSWEELLKPEYKDAICWAHPGTSGAAYTVLSGTVQRLGTDAGFEYLKNLDKNVIVYTKAGAAPFTSCGMGECGIAIGYSDNAQTVVDQGYPVVISYPEEGTGYGVTVTAMVKGGPADEQDAAHAFVKWLMGESAMKLANTEYNQYPLNKNVQADPKMCPTDTIKTINFDAKLSAETKAENCERFEAEVRSSADVK